MDKRRKWISVLIEEGLQVGVLSPEDVMRHTTPSVLATDLPPELVASVLQAGIDGDGFNPETVVKALGAEKIAEHLPLPVLWSCVNEAAEAIVEEHPLSKSATGTSSADATMVDPSDVVADQVLSEDMPEIEVLEE
jgi:hypothetical protein